jgi:hypothetical protein
VSPVHAEALAEDEFAELDQLDVIESSELTLSGAYHSYTYMAAEDKHDISDGDAND